MLCECEEHNIMQAIITFFRHFFRSFFYYVSIAVEWDTKADTTRTKTVWNYVGLKLKSTLFYLYNYNFFFTIIIISFRTRKDEHGYCHSISPLTLCPCFFIVGVFILSSCYFFFGKCRTIFFFKRWTFIENFIHFIHHSKRDAKGAFFKRKKVFFNIQK